MSKMAYKYIHDKSVEGGCGEAAFYYSKKVKPRDLVLSGDAELLNGQIANPNDPIICGSCNRHLPPFFNSRFLVENK